MKQRQIWATALAAAGLLVLAFIVLLSDPGPAADDEVALPIDIESVYDPVAAGEELPPGFRQVLGRDQIAPIYDPTFTDPSRVDWPDEMLVIGVALGDSAKAYPVTPLNQREMVIDSLEGIPILVTW